MKRPPIASLDERKRIILKAVVNDYVSTAEPVGSHVLVTRYQFGVKSATIRGEMAELSEMGYLRQPHTSAGRIPSDLGYRFYVDRLMEAFSLPAAQAAGVMDRLGRHRTEMDIVLEQTCRILADMAQYASVASRPTLKGTVIRHVSIANVGHGKVLAVMVLDNGHVLHEMLDCEPTPKRLDAVRTTNFLESRLSGRSLESASAVGTEPVSEEPAGMGDLLGKVLGFVKRELEEIEETDIHVEGTSYIVQQPEFKDAERLEALLSVLEERGAMYKLFSSVYLGPGVTVIIGSENPLDGMRDCSFVGTKYCVGTRVAGTIGVVGPTRMDYRRAVRAVEFMADNLGDLLTALSVS